MYYSKKNNTFRKGVELKVKIYSYCFKSSNSKVYNSE